MRESTHRAALVLALGSFALTAIAQQQSAPPAQTGGGGGGGGTGGGASAGSSSTRPSPTPTPMPGTPGRGQPQQPGMEQPGRNQTPQMEMSRPIFVSGKVMMDDGTPPPEPVVIERTCGSFRHPEGWTDSKGRFSFQLGDNRAMMSDASVSSADETFGRMGTTGGGSTMGMPGGSRQMTERDLTGCELRAVMPGFRSDMVNLTGRRVLDNPEVGVIILHRLGNVEGTTISYTSIQAPKDAKKAFEKGQKAVKKGKTADAQKEFDKAVGLYPKYATAWFELGMLRQNEKDVEGARKAYQEALAADPKYVSPYLQLAFLSAQEQKWQDVSDTCDRILKLNPIEFPQAYFFSAVANYNLGKLEMAEKSAREAQKIDTEHRFPKVNHLLGVILAQKRDYAGALTSMRSYLQFAPNAQDADAVKKQISELERATGTAAAAKANP